MQKGGKKFRLDFGPWLASSYGRLSGEPLMRQPTPTRENNRIRPCMYPCQVSGLFPTRQGQRLGPLARSVNSPSAKDLISILTNPTVDGTSPHGKR